MIKTKASVRDNRRLLFFLYKWHIGVLYIRESFEIGFFSGAEKCINEIKEV